MKIVNLDAAYLNPGDLSWEGLEKLGDLILYQGTKEEEIVERVSDADIVITNKIPFDRETIEQAPNLKCICVSATGYNIIDVEAAKDHGIVVCNAPSYSNESVAQHVFAGIFAAYNRIENYAKEARSGVWTATNEWCYTNEPISNIYGQTMGILGFGQIGQRVGEIAQAFGMKVVAHHRHPERDAKAGVEFVDLETLFRSADVLSLHVPLNASTKGIVNNDSLSLMKPSSILINTGRGPLIDEHALAQKLTEKKIRAAILDVMIDEPPTASNPLLKCDNCFITPHIAWAGLLARRKLMDILVENIQQFIAGSPINTVN